MSAKYTLTLYDMLQDPNFKLFDFEYDFYCDVAMIQKDFEKKFMQTYLFSEINSESVARWKHMLQGRLNSLMPHYCELYKTIKRCEDIDFMVNKDYKETVIRETNADNINNVDSKNDIKNTSDSTSKDTSKESSLNNGLSEVSLDTGLTGEALSDSTSSGKDLSESKLLQESINKSNEKEIVVNEGRGNIGITSSAQLVEGWRNVIVNIDKKLIEECYDMFMLIF